MQLRVTGLAFAALLTGWNPAVAQEPGAATGSQSPEVEQLLQAAESSIAKVQDYTAVMLKQERFKDGLGKQEKMEIKFARPFKVYIKFLTVFTGREVVFVRGWNGGEVRVHKGSFPDLTVNLDPHGSMAMEGNHHPVTDFGLENTVRVAARNLRLARKRGEGKFEVVDAGVFNGRPAWKIMAEFPRGGSKVTAQKGETLWEISKRTGQDMYLMLYTNKDYDDPDDPDEGDPVFVPRYYGGKAEFFLDKESNLPLKVTTWDWNGQLYETFEYHDLKLNPGLTPKDFDPENPRYNF